jgi:hypothetical protein
MYYLLPRHGYAGVLEADYYEAVRLVWVRSSSGSSKTSKDSLLVTKFFDGPDT